MPQLFEGTVYEFKSSCSKRMSGNVSECQGWKNFWDIEEVELSGVEDILDDSNGISVRNENGSLFILNKKLTL